MQPGCETSRERIRDVRWRTAAGFLIAFSPAIVLAVLVARHAVNTPVWDDWERAPLIEKWESGSLTFHDLFAPHIDHRIFFPRILTLLLNSIGGGDLRWEIGACFLIGLAAALGVWQLARQTMGKNGAASWGVLFVANLMIFSPLKWDGWLSAIQVSFAIPMACLIWALVLAAKPWRCWIRLAASASLAVVGTFSFGHGLFIWPAVFAAVLLVRRPGDTRAKLAFLGYWTAIAVTAIGAYFLVDFRNSSDASHAYGQDPGKEPPAIKNIGHFLEIQQKAAHHFFSSVGNPYSRFLGTDRIEMAERAGGGLLILFLGLGGWALTRFRRRELWNSVMPWVVLGGTTLAILAIVTVARAEIAHVERSLAPRYTGVAYYLPISIVFLLSLLSRSIRWSGWELRRGTVETAFLAGLAALQIPVWMYGAHLFGLWKIARLQGQAELRFINFFVAGDIHRIDATWSFAKLSANILNDRGYLNPPLTKSLDLKQFRPLDRPRPPSVAAVEIFEKLPGGRFRVAGHAQLGKDRPRPADAVFLVRDGGDTGAEGEIFALAMTGKAPLAYRYGYDIEFSGLREADRKDWLRWETTFAIEGPVSVTAYAFDEIRDRAYRIGGRWEIDADGELREIGPSP